MRAAIKGKIIIVVATALFVYATFWLLGSPFLPQVPFPDPWWLEAPVALALGVTVCGAVAFVGYLLL